ncbi:MAG: ORF6N domain-containing protein [Elusimicrobiales bacterium]
MGNTMPARALNLEQSVIMLRGQRVMLDADLAVLYGVATRAFNQTVKRNRKRFPADFMFKLTRAEVAGLMSQFVTSSSGHGGRRYIPYAFTEHGAVMASMLLNSPRVVEMSIHVVRAFIRFRQVLSANAELAGRLEMPERRVHKHDKSLARVFEAMRLLLSGPEAEPGRKVIGFCG